MLAECFLVWIGIKGRETGYCWIVKSITMQTDKQIRFNFTVIETYRIILPAGHNDFCTAVCQFFFQLRCNRVNDLVLIFTILTRCPWIAAAVSGIQSNRRPAEIITYLIIL